MESWKLNKNLCLQCTLIKNDASLHLPSLTSIQLIGINSANTLKNGSEGGYNASCRTMFSSHYHHHFALTTRSIGHAQKLFASMLTLDAVFTFSLRIPIKIATHMLQPKLFCDIPDFLAHRLISMIFELMTYCSDLTNNQLLLKAKSWITIIFEFSKDSNQPLIYS